MDVSKLRVVIKFSLGRGLVFKYLYDMLLYFMYKYEHIMIQLFPCKFIKIVH